MGGFTLGKTAERGESEGTRERSRKRAEGWFDLTGLGGDFDSFNCLHFTEVTSPADILRINSFK